jgi:RNA polymerase sigma-70 factor (ECF subfamily)
MLAVWADPARFRGDSKVSTWIFAIAYYKALKALRRIDEPVEERSDLASEDSGPDECMWQVQR